MNNFIMVILVTCPLYLFGQKSAILTEIQAANSFYNSARQQITTTLSYLDHCQSAATSEQLETYTRFASRSINNAFSYIKHVESNTKQAAIFASELACIDAEEQATLTGQQFLTIQQTLQMAASEFDKLPERKNSIAFEIQLEVVIEHLYDALKQLNNGVEHLSYIIDDLEECDLSTFREPILKSSAFSTSGSKDFAQQVALYLPEHAALDLIQAQGKKEEYLSPIQLYNANWLSEVTAYRQNNKINVIASIKVEAWSLQTTEQLFCNIPDKNWLAFYFGDSDPGLAYGERFEKYILPYRCGGE